MPPCSSGLVNNVSDDCVNVEGLCLPAVQNKDMEDYKQNAVRCTKIQHIFQDIIKKKIFYHVQELPKDDCCSDRHIIITARYYLHQPLNQIIEVKKSRNKKTCKAAHDL